MPRAAFNVTADTATGSDRQLPQMLSQDLNRRFKSSPAEKLRFLPGWSVDLQLGRNTFYVAVKESKHRQDTWILMVTPGGMRGFLALIRGTEISADLLLICREIHAFLINTSGISGVRWYLTGSRTAVETPEELPWSQA
jgi:hypothetical protein